MEGIQHRWDCPARKHLNPATAEARQELERTATDVLVRRQCRYCRRGALTREPIPKETTDEH